MARTIAYAYGTHRCTHYAYTMAPLDNDGGEYPPEGGRTTTSGTGQLAYLYELDVPGVGGRFSGRFETQLRQSDGMFLPEDLTVEDALAWARERAPVVIVRLGGEYYSAGSESIPDVARLGRGSEGSSAPHGDHAIPLGMRDRRAEQRRGRHRHRQAAAAGVYFARVPDSGGGWFKAVSLVG